MNTFTSLEMVNQIRMLAFNLWNACLCSAGQRQHNLFEELRSPQIGDVVMEITTHRMKSRDPLEGIGTLLSITREPTSTRAEWIEAGGEEEGEIPTHQIYTIRLDYDDGREFRWSNASFIKVKTDRINYSA